MVFGRFGKIVWEQGVLISIAVTARVRIMGSSERSRAYRNSALEC